MAAHLCIAFSVARIQDETQSSGIIAFSAILAFFLLLLNLPPYREDRGKNDWNLEVTKLGITI